MRSRHHVLLDTYAVGGRGGAARRGGRARRCLCAAAAAHGGRVVAAWEGVPAASPLSLQSPSLLLVWSDPMHTLLPPAVAACLLYTDANVNPPVRRLILFKRGSFYTEGLSDLVVVAGGANDTHSGAKGLTGRTQKGGGALSRAPSRSQGKLRGRQPPGCCCRCKTGGVGCTARAAAADKRVCGARAGIPRMRAHARRFRRPSRARGSAPGPGQHVALPSCAAERELRGRGRCRPPQSRQSRAAPQSRATTRGPRRRR